MSQLRRTQCRIAWFGNRSFWHFACCCVTASTREPAVCFFSLFPFFAASTMHCKHAFDALLARIYSALFTQQIASHRLTRSGIHCLALCSKPVRPRERERKREEGEGQFELEFGQSSNVFPGCLHGLIKSTPLARALVATRGGLWCCCHGFPAGQAPPPTTLLPTRLCLNRCCDVKFVHKNKTTFLIWFFFFFFLQNDGLYHTGLHTEREVCNSFMHTCHDNMCIYKQVFTQEIILQCIFF